MRAYRTDLEYLPSIGDIAVRDPISTVENILRLNECFTTWPATYRAHNIFGVYRDTRRPVTAETDNFDWWNLRKESCASGANNTRKTNITGTAVRDS